MPKDPRLNTDFIDIPLDASVIQYNGVVTTNPEGETLTRILIGRYDDPIFGSTVATGYVNIAPPVSFTIPDSTATFDSLVLQLNFDYYYHGQKNASTQRLQIYELLDTLHNGKYYTNNSSIALSNSPLTETTFEVDGSIFDDAQIVNADTDTTNNRIFTIRAKIPGTMGQNLFADLHESDNSPIFSWTQFSGKYKGFGLVVPNGGGDKILGINPVYRDPSPKVTDTKLSLYYTQAGVSVRADFVLYASVSYSTGQLNPVTSFSTIKTDRGSGPLAGIVPFKDFKPADGKYYIQGGTSLITKIDLGAFYAFADTTQHISFSEAQLLVTNQLSQQPTGFLALRLLDSLNHFKSAYLDTLRLDTLRTIVNPFFTKIASSVTLGNSIAEQFVNVNGDLATNFAILPDTYELEPVYITQFCQQLYKYRRDPRRPKAMALIVDNVAGRKSIDGAVLQGGMTLRLFYAKPVIKIR